MSTSSTCQFRWKAAGETTLDAVPRLEAKNKAFAFTYLQSGIEFTALERDIFQHSIMGLPQIAWGF